MHLDIKQWFFVVVVIVRVRTNMLHIQQLHTLGLIGSYGEWWDPSLQQTSEYKVKIQQNICNKANVFHNSRIIFVWGIKKIKIKNKIPHTISLHFATCNHVIPSNGSSNFPPSFKHLHPPSCMHKHVWKMLAWQVTRPQFMFKTSRASLCNNQLTPLTNELHT